MVIQLNVKKKENGIVYFLIDKFIKNVKFTTIITARKFGGCLRKPNLHEGGTQRRYLFIKMDIQWKR